MNINELLDKCIKKDPVAWETFTKRYLHVITRSVRYKLKKFGHIISKNETSDIVQEILLTIWEKDKLREVAHPECLTGWLAIVSINFTSNYMMRKIQKKNILTLSLEEPRESEVALKDLLRSSFPLPIETAQLNELIGLLNAEIEKLPYQHQLILKFNLYDGKTQKEISRIMGLPLGTVAIIIKRSKEKLKSALKKILFF